MSTYFDTLAKNYTEVPVTDEGIATVPFAEATDGVVKLFDLLGSVAFTMVQSDMNGNLKKIRDRYETDTAANSTLEKLVINEKDEKKRVATEGLLWLMRGLEFTSVALRRLLDNPDEELGTAFTKAYGETLKKFHGLIAKGAFTVAMKACPLREDFFKKLGEDQERVVELFNVWLTALEKLVARLKTFYTTGGHDKGF
ncbi:3450_t:CDS:2 [Paraglomus occultum]|uniref:3450_t:CDS:1 n=1 Tax=Paraglomus occultum TaxID=144539 RepID=A0A9N9FSA4_9GLOM|nr:3450_t:CDS:2 [Paraglomus occultum]